MMVPTNDVHVRYNSVKDITTDSERMTLPKAFELAYF